MCCLLSLTNLIVRCLLLTLFFLFGWSVWLAAIDRTVFVPAKAALWNISMVCVVPSPTANFWCSVNASADATISFLCFSALLTRSVEVKKLVLRAFAIYAVFHWGACWWWSVHGDQHPAAMAIAYPISITISLVAMLYWGWLYPPFENYQGVRMMPWGECS